MKRKNNFNINKVQIQNLLSMPYNAKATDINNSPVLSKTKQKKRYNQQVEKPSHRHI